MLPARELLRLDLPSDTSTVDHGDACVVHDVRNFENVMTTNNAYVFEQLFSGA